MKHLNTHLWLTGLAMLLTLLSQSAAAQGRAPETWGPVTLPEFPNHEMRVEVGFTDDGTPYPKEVCLEGQGNVVCIENNGLGDENDGGAIEFKFKGKKLFFEFSRILPGTIFIQVDEQVYALQGSRIWKLIEPGSSVDPGGMYIGDLLRITPGATVDLDE